MLRLGDLVKVCVYYNPKRQREFYVAIGAKVVLTDPEFPGEVVYFRGYRNV